MLSASWPGVVAGCFLSWQCSAAAAGAGARDSSFGGLTDSFGWKGAGDHRAFANCAFANQEHDLHVCRFGGRLGVCFHAVSCVCTAWNHRDPFRLFRFGFNVEGAGGRSQVGGLRPTKTPPPGCKCTCTCDNTPLFHRCGLFPWCLHDLPLSLP